MNSILYIKYITQTSTFFSAVNCGNLTNPANGQVAHTAGTTFGQTATYSCNAGYYLVGESNRTCQATGNWSESAPTCQGMLLLYFMLYDIFTTYACFWMVRTKHALASAHLSP